MNGSGSDASVFQVAIQVDLYLIRPVIKIYLIPDQNFLQDISCQLRRIQIEAGPCMSVSMQTLSLYMPTQALLLVLHSTLLSRSVQDQVTYHTAHLMYPIASLHVLSVQSRAAAEHVTAHDPNFRYNSLLSCVSVVYTKSEKC